jgi:predicted ABC-type ATPase
VSAKRLSLGAFLPKYADCKNFINADLIAQGMSPFSPEAAAVRAGRLMLSEIKFFSRRRDTFAFETTLVRAKLFEVDSAAQETGIPGTVFLSCGEGC